MVFGCLKIGDLAKISFNREDNDKPWDVGPTLLGFWRSLGDRPLLGIDLLFFFRNFQVVLEIGDEGMAMLDLQGIQIIQYPRAQV
jgi:hypothetical protein